jgi:hypothetical protein
MRVIAASLLALLVAVPATAQTAGQKAAAPKAQRAGAAAAVPQGQQAPAAQAKKAAAPAAKKKKAAKGKNPPKASPALIAAYAAMPVAERRALQSDLVWSGDYDGIIGDEFGERSIAAVKSYQASIGTAETGLLTAEQRAALAAAAKAKQEASGWRIVDDAATGVRLAVPAKHAPQSSAIKSGTRWSSARGEVQVETFRIAEPGTTLNKVFEQQKKEPINRMIEYSVLRDNFFVLSGLQGLKRFYVRAQAKDTEVRGFLIMYDQAMQGIMDPVAVAMSSRFEAFPTDGPPPRRKVEYATGIFVDNLGHLITDRAAVDGCEVISLAGLGNGERVAETADVALVRVYGARNIAPIRLAAEAGSPANATLIGIADPQAQGGNSATTTATVRVGAANGALRPLDPAPALGFSGAAAVDAQGRLIGMALVRSAVVAGSTAGGAQAQLVGLDSIKMFLDGRNVAPAASGATDLEAAKASVVRVICVRR